MNEFDFQKIYFIETFIEYPILNYIKFEEILKFIFN